ncbi:MAG TPA: hypothetical protein ENI86_15280 [Acidimicrobiales bacterium]|nr:hypothetical protein [Acidimicrobiales bacterium]
MNIVTVPRLGEMTEEVVVIEWLVSVGDRVEEGTPLLLVETDKVESEINATAAGVVTELLVAEDDELAVGDPICRIGEGA